MPRHIPIFFLGMPEKWTWICRNSLSVFPNSDRWLSASSLLSVSFTFAYSLIYSKDPRNLGSPNHPFRALEWIRRVLFDSLLPLCCVRSIARPQGSGRVRFTALWKYRDFSEVLAFCCCSWLAFLTDPVPRQRWIQRLSSQLAYPWKTQRVPDLWCSSFEEFICLFVSLYGGCRSNMLSEAATTGILSFDPWVGSSHVVMDSCVWAATVSLACQSVPQSWGETPVLYRVHATELSHWGMLYAALIETDMFNFGKLLVSTLVSLRDMSILQEQVSEHRVIMYIV